jgi:hypothetical protein
MPIPAFNQSGILPPFTGADPGQNGKLMSPYGSSPSETVARFATSLHRATLLVNWLTHRRELRAVGFSKGQQWLDGSFVENKQPADLDVVTFFHRPPRMSTVDQLMALRDQHPDKFLRARLKTRLQLDAVFIDLNMAPVSLVNVTRYWFGLFSHQRTTMLWKGMVAVDLYSDDNDDAALAAASAARAAHAQPAVQGQVP